MTHTLTLKARRAVVRALERTCGVLDRIPYYDRTDHRWYRIGAWGCHLGLAKRSYRLDVRWATNAWDEPAPREGPSRDLP